MNKIQKIYKKLLGDQVFIFLSLIFILILYVSLSPKISSVFFPIKSEISLNNFISEAKLKNQVDANKYWEFREFYSPGSFIFSRTGISLNKLSEIKNIIDIEKSSELSFLYFSSSKIKSIDSLTQQTDIRTLINKEMLIPNNIIIFNNKILIYKYDDKTYLFCFLFTNSQMQKANGFLDYKGKDKLITNERYWLSVSTVGTK